MPERQMKRSSLSLFAPMGVSASVTRSTKAVLSWSPGKLCHSTSTGRLPMEDNSGRPTQAHSAIVLTSMRTESAFRLSLAQVSSTPMESIWTSPPTLPAPPVRRRFLSARQNTTLGERRRTPTLTKNYALQSVTCRTLRRIPRLRILACTWKTTFRHPAGRVSGARRVFWWTK